MIGSVLITGGTGFFAQAFINRLLGQNLSDRICLFSRDEYKQSIMRRQYHDDRLRWFIGDVRDEPRLRTAMRNVDTVIHAAALKRIEVGYYDPSEMTKTNVNGAINVIEAAVATNVKHVVFLSSDKAYEPVSPYGQTKALAESIFLSANRHYSASGTTFSMTRYGNVAGSTGSVIPVWREILKTSDTVPVTDPACTRFWMSTDEAVDLVLDTALNKEGGQLIIPKLPAFRLGDLALAMKARINIIGLPEHEKKHESMCFGNCSETAQKLSIDEIKERLEQV